MYIRFQGRRGGGIFAVGLRTRTRLKEQRIARGRTRAFEDAFCDLSRSTPAPPPEVFAPGGRRRATRCWFKASAPQVEHARRTADSLRAIGVRIRTIRSSSPGPILYQDTTQVVVVGPPDRARPATSPRKHKWNGDRDTIRRAPQTPKKVQS